MKRLMLVAALALAPCAALAEEKKEKPGVVESVGTAAAGALGYSAGAAGGPLGSAVGGLVGQRLGKGLIGGIKKLFGGGKKDEPVLAQAPPAPALAPVAAEAEAFAAPAAALAADNEQPAPAPAAAVLPPAEAPPSEPAPPAAEIVAPTAADTVPLDPLIQPPATSNSSGS